MTNKEIIAELRKPVVPFNGKKMPLSLYGSFALGTYGEKDVILTDEEIEAGMTDKYMIVFLNMSAPVRKEWGNFHYKEKTGRGGSDGAKNLYPLFERFPELKGSYMTDFYKGRITPDEGGLEKEMAEQNPKERAEYEQVCIDLLRKEIEIMGNDQIVILAAGKKVAEALKGHFPYRRVCHCSNQALHRFLKNDYETWRMAIEGEPR